jgi:hypothetical protein
MKRRSFFTVTWLTAVATVPATAMYPAMVTTAAGRATGAATSAPPTAVSTVIVNALPLVNITSAQSVICSGETSTLTANGSITYTWNTGSNANNIAVSPGATSIYSVRGSGANGCTNKTTFTITVNACSGIVGFASENELVIYPNPTSGKFFLRLQKYESANLAIFSLTGIKIYNSVIYGEISEIDLSGQTNGIYFIEIKQSGIALRSKLIKQ